MFDVKINNTLAMNTAVQFLAFVYFDIRARREKLDLRERHWSPVFKALPVAFIVWIHRAIVKQ